MNENKLFSWLKIAFQQPIDNDLECFYYDKKLNEFFSVTILERLLIDEKYKINFNISPYYTNQELKKILFTWTKKFAPTDVLDLFAGNGNLSEEANYSKRLCVDYYQKSVTDPFTSQDLYYPKALEEIRKKIKTIGLNPATIILDPPRSGLKNLDEWLEAFAPQRVAYISCDPHTLVRDLMQIKNYKITELHLIDFFPSTFHFETMVFLERT